MSSVEAFRSWVLSRSESFSDKQLTIARWAADYCYARAIEEAAKRIETEWLPHYPESVFPEDTTSPTGLAGRTMRHMLPRVAKDIRKLAP